MTIQRYQERQYSNKGACKNCISTLGVGGGSEGNAYFAYAVRGGVEAKCLYWKGSKFLFT